MHVIARSWTKHKRLYRTRCWKHCKYFTVRNKCCSHERDHHNKLTCTSDSQLNVPLRSSHCSDRFAYMCVSHVVVVIDSQSKLAYVLQARTYKQLAAARNLLRQCTTNKQTENCSEASIAITQMTIIYSRLKAIHA